MITELTWDSQFFKRKMGELKITSESLNQLETIIKKAKDKNFKYIICKIKSQDVVFIKLLEALGFYLSDIGVTWEIDAVKFSFKGVRKNSIISAPIKVATDRDIPWLKKMSGSLFLESRFYSDPFFPKEEADKLYQTWIENSVKGKVADVVFCVPNIGFVTCKKSSVNIGEIILIGIKEDFKGKGVGTLLIEEVVKWFKTQGVNLISVRTQLRNLNAMNFYNKLGFYVKEYDILFAKIL